MKLPRAIEITSDIEKTGRHSDRPEDKDALKLVIEAGKCVINNRLFGIPNSINPLPGETEE